jgi:hypothetical protein
MKYEIPQDILELTECNSEYITFLKSGISKEVLQQCAYVFSAYDKLICKCPVRYYLFEESKI